MFGITISFLSLVTFLSIVMRPSRKAMQVFNEERTKDKLALTAYKKQIGVDLLEIIKMQNEINELRKNGN